MAVPGEGQRQGWAELASMDERVAVNHEKTIVGTRYTERRETADEPFQIYAMPEYDFSSRRISDLDRVAARQDDTRSCQGRRPVWARVSGKDDC